MQAGVNYPKLKLKHERDGDGNVGNVKNRLQLQLHDENDQMNTTRSLTWKIWPLTANTHRQQNSPDEWLEQVEVEVTPALTSWLISTPPLHTCEQMHPDQISPSLPPSRRQQQHHLPAQVSNLAI